MRIENNKNKNNKTVIIVVLSVILIAALALAYYFYTQKKAAEEREQQYGSSSTTPTENLPKAEGNNQADGGSIGSSKTETDASSTSTQNLDLGVTPKAPIGTFVSNHRPNLGGSPAPNSLNSSCTTTPGASCIIEFSNGSTTKSLPQKVADENGNASWDWKLQDIGLTEGTWTVTAIAKNGPATVQSSDPVKLEVRP